MEKCGEVAKSCGCDLLVIKLLERILVMFQQRTHISSGKRESTFDGVHSHKLKGYTLNFMYNNFFEVVYENVSTSSIELK